MADDELERLRAALAHAHDQEGSGGGLLRRLSEALRKSIQKRAIADRVKTPAKKEAGKSSRHRDAA